MNLQSFDGSPLFWRESTKASQDFFFLEDDFFLYASALLRRVLSESSSVCLHTRYAFLAARTASRHSWDHHGLFFSLEEELVGGGKNFWLAERRADLKV